MIDEKVELEKWFVLQKINRSSGYHFEDEAIEYRIFTPPNIYYEEMPFLINESRILKLFDKKGIINILNPPEGAIETAVIPELLYIGRRKRTISFTYLKIGRYPKN